MKEAQSKLPGQTTGSERGNIVIGSVKIVFILLFLTLVATALIYILDYYVNPPTQSSSSPQLPTKGAQPPEISERNILIVPVRPAGEQVLEQTDLDMLRSHLNPHGWSVQRDSSGNLVLAPVAATSAPASGGDVEPTRTDINLSSLRTILEPHGWKVSADDEGGGVLLIPESSP